TNLLLKVLILADGAPVIRELGEGRHIAEAASGREGRVREVLLLRFVDLPDARVGGHDSVRLEIAFEGTRDAACQYVPHTAVARGFGEPADVTRGLDVLARCPQNESPSIDLDVRTVLVPVRFLFSTAVIASDRNPVGVATHIRRVLADGPRV